MVLFRPLNSAPSGTDYLKAALSAPMYEVAVFTPLQTMSKISQRLENTIGVALSANKTGVYAVIVIPVATVDIKVDAVRQLGGEVLLYGANFDEAKAKDIALSQEKGYTYVPPL